MKIAVLANLKKNAPTWEGMPADRWDDLDSPKTIDGIVNALKAGGHEAEFFEASLLPPYSLVERLQEYKPDLCFNIAEGHFGDGREAQIPSVLEMLQIPYTGSQVVTLALALDKPMTKRVLMYHHLPTPEFQVFESADETIDSDLINEDGELRFPMFVKPSREGTSMGVSAESIVNNTQQLREQVAHQIKQYNQPILCERYIKGREITVGILGNFNPTTPRYVKEPLSLPDTLIFMPALEVDLDKYDASEAGLYTNKMKVEMADDFRYTCPANVDRDLLAELHRLTAAVFQVLGCRDVSRVDFRIDESGKPYILEVNPLPGLNPGYSDLCIQSQVAGWSHEKLINAIVGFAAERYGLQEKVRENHP